MSYQGICNRNDKACRLKEYQDRQTEWKKTCNCNWKAGYSCYICDKDKNICERGEYEKEKERCKKEAQEIASLREQFRDDFILKTNSGHETQINALNKANIQRYNNN